MTIALADIKIRKSQRMTDFDDGGGLMIGTEVLDGVVNDVFDDVSRTDRSNGDCSLRKIYPHVSSANTDRLLDGHFIITDQPVDPNVTLCAIKNGGFATERAAVQTYLESIPVEDYTDGLDEAQPGTTTTYDTTLAVAVGLRLGVQASNGGAFEPATIVSIADQGGGINRVTFAPAASQALTGAVGQNVKVYTTVGADSVASTVGFASGALQNDTVITLDSVRAAVAPDVLVSDPEIIGINPVLIGNSGTLMAFEQGKLVVILNTQPDTMPNPLSASQMVQLSRTDLATIRVEDDGGLDVPSAGYWTVDLALGQITFDAALDLTGYAEPLVVYHRIENQRTVTQVDEGAKTITINRGLSRDFGADSFAASALYLGNMQARYKSLADVKVWSDYGVGGEAAVASYDDAAYPIEVANLGAQSHRWALVFTSATTYEVRNEDRGTLATGNTGADLTVTNNQTGEDYFTIRSAGWGSGWINGNALEFETVAAAEPVWLCRVVQDEDAAVSDDLGRVEFRGDAE